MADIKCTYCSKTFTRPQAYGNHKKVHLYETNNRKRRREDFEGKRIF